ncbi:uncharacterized protein N7483_002466 [Penicillium malachiteum]|uniref:uncharacterized protein n=1 Tax=Penicillium malachiteum TaxID=1324776 RepID=UPI0025480CAF|nr:uncharacterized protein N7483_002466 [Penicillium malachiteum]KAJ5737341.1 hypothetical protein N7483_002466 [Penicillium malachiteum]
MEYLWNGSYSLPCRATFADNVKLIENDFDLDLHQIWKESDLPAQPLCLAMDFDESKPDSLHLGSTAAQRVQHPIVECLFYSNTEGEHLFFIPRIETASWKFEHIRKEIVGIVYHSACVMPGSHFRLSLWPRVEPFPCSASSTLSPLAALPTLPSLHPSEFVHNLRENFMSDKEELLSTLLQQLQT